MARDDATDEGMVQVVGKSRELRALSTKLYEELRVRKLRAQQCSSGGLDLPQGRACNSLDLTIWAWAMRFWGTAVAMQSRQPPGGGV